jgi:hypothetical protein
MSIDGVEGSQTSDSSGEATFTVPYGNQQIFYIVNAYDQGYDWYLNWLLPDQSKTITAALTPRGSLPPATNETVTVQITVLHHESPHEPIQGAKVTLGYAVQTPYGGEIKYTNSNGVATFLASPETEYMWTVEKSGYQTRSEFMTTFTDNTGVTVYLSEGDGYLPPLRNRPNPFPYQDSPILGDIGTQYANMIDSWFLGLQSIIDQLLQVGIEPVNNAKEAINLTLNSISNSAESTTSTAGFAVVLQMFSAFLGAIPPIIINLVSLVLASDIVIMLLNRPIS